MFQKPVRPSGDGVFMDLCRHIALQTSAVWTNMVMIMEPFGLRPNYDDFRRFVSVSWMGGLLQSVEGIWKFAFADAFCHWTKQTEFPSPPRFFKSGLFFACFPSMGRKLKKLDYSWAWNRETRYKFAYSILNGKKGTEAIPWWDVEAGLSKFETLAQKPFTPDPKWDPVIMSEITRTVRQLIKPVRESHLNSLLPSSSAHYGVRRKDGGGTTALFSKCAGQRTSSKVGEFDVPEPKSDELMAAVEELKKVFDQNEWHDGEIHLVKEPFKLRSITTTNVALSYVGKYLQRMIHRQLSRHPAFSFAFGEVTVDDLSSWELYGEDYLCSGDYEAATDNLFVKYSSHCWQEICKQMEFDPWVYEVFNWGLAKNRWHFPSGRVLEQSEKVQPMGYILSFTLLCIINFALARYVCEIDEMESIRRERRGSHGLLAEKRLKWNMRNRCPVRINGDDVLMKLSSRDSYDLFKGITAAAGLIPSIGKNYTSREFGMINSKLLVVVRDWFGVGRVRFNVPYVNVGLIKGTGRVLSDTRIEDSCSSVLGNVSESTHALALRHDTEFASSLLSQYIAWNYSVLTGTMRDWYLPTCLGGLGMWRSGRRLQPLSRAAALVAQLAFERGGVCLDRETPEANSTSEKYRKGVPFAVERVDDMDVVEPSCDDSYFFWSPEVIKPRVGPTSEQLFRRLYGKAKKDGVRPMVGRQFFSFRRVPLFQMIPVKQINPFFLDLSTLPVTPESCEAAVTQPSCLVL